MKQGEVEANGISLHFVEEGEGPAVVFCHGFPAIWSSRKAQMEAVASGWSSKHEMRPWRGGDS
jgi:pimeloyl-ACP methyl ester carboxylesterase